MIDVKRMRAALVIALMGPIAACSSVPSVPDMSDTFDFIPGIGGDGGPQETAPSDGRISILELEDSLQVSETAEVTLPTAYVNTVWPQPGGYPTHALQHTQASGSLSVIWRESVGEGSDNHSRLNARPVMANGNIYVMDADGAVTAVDAETGARVWRQSIGGRSERDRMSFGGGLAFDAGRIYAHVGLAFFVALDADTGQEIWRNDEMLVPFHGSPTVVDGRIFVASDDNELLALDTDDGEVMWTYQGIVETARLLTSPSPAVLGDIVVAPFASGELVALRVQNGNPVWSDSLNRTSGLNAMSAINDVAGSPVIVENMVYAMSHSGILTAISLRTGERAWSLPAGGLHAPWVAGDFLFIVTAEAQVVAVNRHDGSIQWIRQLPLFENEQKREDRIAWAGPIMAGGRVFVASSHGEAVVINAYDGEITTEFELRDDVYVAPIIANETIYIVSDEGRLIALR